MIHLHKQMYTGSRVYLTSGNSVTVIFLLLKDSIVKVCSLRIWPKLILLPLLEYYSSSIFT